MTDCGVRRRAITADGIERRRRKEGHLASKIHAHTVSCTFIALSPVSDVVACAAKRTSQLEAHHSLIAAARLGVIHSSTHDRIGASLHALLPACTHLLDECLVPMDGIRRRPRFPDCKPSFIDAQSKSGRQLLS
jgi:hypothetical protein